MRALPWFLALLGATAPLAAPQDLPPPPNLGGGARSGEDPTSREAIRRVLEAAPKRQRLDGMWGVRARSKVLFDSAPDRPHELVMTAAFPARTRVELTSKDGRHERYQLGRALFGRDSTPGAPAPGYALSGASALESELDMALRRGVFLWPDAFEFVGAGRSRTAKVRELGVLVATLDEETGRPVEMSVFGPDGRSTATFKGIEWREGERRAWPSKLEFWADNRRIWTETVRDAEGTWTFGDPWFLPPDLMGRAIGETEDASVRMRANEGALVMVEELPAPIGIDAATGAMLKRWAELDQKFGAIGQPLEASAAVRLDDKRRATALEFRMPVRDGAAPEGWILAPGTSCWVVLAGDGTAEVMESAQGQMERLVRDQRVHGAVRLRIELNLTDGGATAGLHLLEADAVETEGPRESPSEGPSPPETPRKQPPGPGDGRR